LTATTASAWRNAGSKWRGDVPLLHVTAHGMTAACNRMGIADRLHRRVGFSRVDPRDPTRRGTASIHFHQIDNRNKTHVKDD
jgi:hypothetical protein